MQTNTETTYIVVQKGQSVPWLVNAQSTCHAIVKVMGKTDSQEKLTAWPV